MSVGEKVEEGNLQTFWRVGEDDEVWTAREGNARGLEMHVGTAPGWGSTRETKGV